jgi:hypothetical protein
VGEVSLQGRRGRTNSVGLLAWKGRIVEQRRSVVYEAAIGAHSGGTPIIGIGTERVKENQNIEEKLRSLPDTVVMCSGTSV